MGPELTIRDETDADTDAITEVMIAAFRAFQITNHTEQFIIAALRAAHALTVSLVAELDGQVVGHIVFSPVIIADGTEDWYGLGPLSVPPEYHRQGIGGYPIREGLSRLKALSAGGCCLVGHPEYYRRFGFDNASGLTCEVVPSEVFLLYLRLDALRRPLSCSTRDSKQTANKSMDWNDPKLAHLITALDVKPAPGRDMPSGFAERDHSIPQNLQIRGFRERNWRSRLANRHSPIDEEWQAYTC